MRERPRGENKGPPRPSTAFLLSFIKAVPGVIYAKDLDGRLLAGNDGVEKLLGRTFEDFVGRTDLELLDDKVEAAAVMANDRRIMDSGVAEQVEEQVTYPDGSTAWWLSTKAPLRAPDGAIVGLVGSSLDITERRRAAQEQEMLLGEMQHRARNLGVVIEALGRQSRPPGEPAVDAFIEVFLGRLRALLSSGDLIFGSRTRHADLKTLFETVLKPFVDPARPSAICLEGPALSIAEQTCGNLLLATHELATNALKYGSLKSPRGRVAISWSVHDESDGEQVRIVWKETGGDTIARPPERRGFGSRVIRAAVSAEQGGQTDIAYEPDGLRCDFQFINRGGR